MSQTKYKLPPDLKMQCLSLVKGYERRVLLYHNRRAKIIYGSSLPPDGLPKSDSISDTTANKAVKLVELEKKFDTQAMRAVEQAKNCIGNDLVNESDRQQLIESIWESCIEGRNFKFVHKVLPLGKDNFYERRRQFLWNIANTMGFL